jgi:hypothetical protein
VSIGILDAALMQPIDLRMRAYPFSVASERRDMGVLCLDHAWHHRPAGPTRAAAPTRDAALALPSTARS